MEGKDLELLAIGDATMDVFITPSESETLCEIDSKECLICFSYGDKIPVKSIDFSVGGNAANNAVGTKRLGVRSGMLVTLGGDTIGNQIIEKLEKEEVDLSFAIQQPTADSNYSTIINYSGERTIFSYHAPRSYEFPVHMPEVPWIYLTSMGETFPPFYNHFVDWLNKKENIKLAFNPGSRQLRADYKYLEPIMKKTHVIYVNRKEAEKLTGKKESQGQEKELLKALFDLGPEICIVTDGADGSLVYDGKKFIKAGVLPVDAHERTGAGDAFGAGCIAALVKDKPFEEALLWGTLNSASVIGYTGSQRGLLREDELPLWIQRAKSSEVKIAEF